MPRIAIVGAGISGLTCARTLFDHGYQVQLFEKSRGFGGRMATRRADLFHFDHGAQYFTVRDARFRRYVESWQQDGVVSPWDGRIAVLGKSSATELAKATERYVALPGMNALAKHLGNHLPVRFQTRIGQIEPTQGAWHVLSDQAESLGEFDFVVFAIPAAQAADLLPAGKLQERASHCEMNPCWAAMFGFTESLRAEYDAAFVHNSPISWIARNGSKPARPAEHEAWVVHANPEWSLRHDGESQEAVAELLRHEFASVIGKDMPSVAHSAAHFWRYAIPTSPLTESCLFDGELRIAACGDWCAGPRVEGAFLSGAAAAGQIMGHYNTSWTAKPVALGD
jgi:predicted NAD/FAD-dependent oxidoreductase